MNKKVSTILTLSLMLGGSLLSSSAFAEKLPVGKIVSADNKFVSGGTYFIIQDENAALTDTKGALGYFYKDSKQEEIVPTVTLVGDNGVSKENFANYLWTVTEVNLEGKGKVYQFYNAATKMYLMANKDANGQYDIIETHTDAASQEGDAKDFAFTGWNAYDGVASGRMLYVSASAMDTDGSVDDKVVKITGAGQNQLTLIAPAGGLGINLYSVADAEIVNPGDELNSLYNMAGFNFKIEEGVDNIFANGKIKAIKVEAGDIDAWDNGDYSFPAGTYFAVETPAGDYASLTGSTQEVKEARKNYLLNSTFIAVSPVSNVADNATEQAAGRGFTLTTVSGQDLNCYTETNPGDIVAEEQTSGSEISVYNACFKGWENAGVADKYALALDNVRYQAKADDEAHAQKALSLNVIAVHYGAQKYLATADYATNHFVFELEKTSAIDPVEDAILNESRAAIYNIQFVSGDESDDESEYGKYLMVSPYSNYWAKGSALTDLNTPAFQFVVSKVVDKNITFTNRETGKSFTTMLYPETTEGEDVYSVAISGTTTLYVADVQNNGDVEQVTPTSDLNKTLIKLIPVSSVDKFAGFLNVEDETIMTLTLARDLEPTSNKYYPTVNDGNTAFGDLTDEVSEAVQWQLVKATKEPTYKVYDYYYIKDGKATIKNAGDTVAVQAYNLQLVKDGQAVDKYININRTSVSLGSKTNVYIKENVDGSVSIKSAVNKSIIEQKYMSVTDYRATEYGEGSGEFGSKDDLMMRDVAETSKATEVKTFLASDAPVISWQNQGHATLQSEEGLYITMEENNDGKVNSIEPETFYLTKTDTNKAIPSFYISKGINGDAATERMYLFNPVDSIPYLVNAPVDERYQWDEETTKAIFKAGTLLTPDTMKTIIKAEETVIAQKADNEGVEGGLDRFKFQIIEDEEGTGYYYIRQTSADKNRTETFYLRNLNGKLTWTKSSATKAERVKVAIEEVAAPTANEAISATDVKVVAYDGSINIKNAAGKNVVVSTILGQIVANEVLTSDNATISVPAGIAIVSVDGEEAVKVSVR